MFDIPVFFRESIVSKASSQPTKMQSKGLPSNPENSVSSQPPLSLTGSDLSVRQFGQLVQGDHPIQLADVAELKDRMQRSVEVVEQVIKKGQPIYGVTTGFGGLACESVSADLAEPLQQNLLSFLASGVGKSIDAIHVRGAMIARANMLLKGNSGIRIELVERIIDFLNVGATPVVKEHGSIGASGDLVPLAAVARAVSGHPHQVNVQFRGREIPSSDFLGSQGWSPIELKAKEGLALINGTSFSTAIAANSLIASKRLFALALGIQAIMLRSLLAHEQPFDSFVHDSKPHPGQRWVAAIIRRLLAGEQSSLRQRSHPVQDRYSIRCLPQYLGPIAEGFHRLGQVVETELNGITDNPLVDVENARLVQSGNFLGQSIGLGMDDLRRWVALTAKHLDLQIGMLVAPEFNGGLSASLVGNTDSPINMGLKGLQIAGNSIVPMLTQQASPLVEHFPTYAEQFNQNVNGLSWGAANLAWRSVDLWTDYTSIALLFALQAADLRCYQLEGHYDGRKILGPELQMLYASVLTELDIDPSEARPFVFDDKDRCLELDVARLSNSLRSKGQILEFQELILRTFEHQLEIG